MTTFTTLVGDYVGRGLIANRPATPNIGTTTTALYYATDTTNFYYWSGSAWVLFATGGSGAPGGSNHQIQYNNAGVLGGIAQTNGQLLIGSTGATPVAASLTAPAAGLTITGGAGTVTFALANDLAALEAMSGTGLAAHTGAATWTERTITGTASRISMTNGNGVSGNPTIDIDAAFGIDGLSDVTITAGAENDILALISSVWLNKRPHYGMGFSAPQTTVYSASQVMGHHRVPCGITIPANFGAYLGRTSEAGGSAVTTGSTIFSVDKAGTATPNTFSQIGTITFAAGTVTPTFATSGGTAQTFAAGDVLRIVAPGTPDATFAGFYATIIGYQT